MVKSYRIKSFWILFLSLVSLCAIASGIYYFVTLTNDINRQKSTIITDENVYKQRVENQFQQSLYSIQESLTAIDKDIDKVLLCNDIAMQQELLTEIAINSNNINVSVSALPLISSDNSVAIEQITNKVTQYTLSLSRHLAEGKALTDKDRASLEKISNAFEGLAMTVRKVMTEDSGMYITNSLFADGANAVNDAVDNIDCKIFDIGELYYDGIYSADSKTIKVPKTEVTMKPEQGVDTVKQFFNGFVKVKSVKYNHTLKNGGMLYNYTVMSEDGSIDVMLTTNGKIASFDYNYDEQNTDKEELTLKECYDIAEQFAKKIDSNLTAVWVRHSDGDIAYVNIVPQYKGVLIYPEMIKVSVNIRTGKIEGMQAYQYASHSIDYKIVNIGKYDYKSITDKFYEGADVLDVKYALVEKCCNYYTCYQLQVDKGEQTFFAFVDTNSGKVIDIIEMKSDAVDGLTAK